MNPRFLDPAVLARFDTLIEEGEKVWAELQATGGKRFRDAVWPTRWSTSCLNLLDRLSVATNRFASEFERFRAGPDGMMNLALALGVIQAARDEYRNGFAVEYHLRVAGTIFTDLISQAEYLLSSGYTRAAAVLLGASLEEGLKARARAQLLEVGPRETLFPIIERLVQSGDLNPFQADRLKAVGRIRNDAAHGGEFEYEPLEVRKALEDVRDELQALLGGR